MQAAAPRTVGRYSLFDEIASGGMATVRFGRALGPLGFARTVAVKCLHPSLAREREFVDMFLDEARLAARISHPHVVTTLDVVAEGDELLVVMEYVPGESLSRLHRACRRRGERVPLAIACAVTSGFLEGLHAAHEARSDRGEPLGLVHRDVSPQNVLVGADGVARVLDFGIAKAAGRLHQTRDGRVKGKIAYMAPEQMLGEAVDRRTDVYAAGVVLWELLAGRGLFHAESDQEICEKVLAGASTPPSALAPEVPRALDEVVMRALARAPERRFPDARAMAEAIEEQVPVVPARRIGEWVRATAADALARREAIVAAIEASTAEPARSPVPPAASSSPRASGPRASSPRASQPGASPPEPEAATVPEARPAEPSPTPMALPSARAARPPKDAGRSELRVVAVGVGAFLVAGAVALGVGLSGGPAASPAPSAPPREPRSADRPPESFGSAGASPSAPGASASDAPVKASAAEPSARRGAAPQASTARPRPAAAPRCDPPWVKGPDGIKRMKPECL